MGPPKFALKEIVLKKGVSLYSATKTHAVFVDCGEADNTVDPFFYAAQFKNAISVIKLTWDDVYALIEVW